MCKNLDAIFNSNNLNSKITCNINFIDKLKDKNIIIYGAGYMGIIMMKFFKSIGIEIVCFIDKYKAGTIINDINVKEPCKIIDQRKYFVIVSMYVKDDIYVNIKKELIDLGFQNIIHVFELRQWKLLSEYQPIPIYVEYSKIIGSMFNIKKIYNLLEDNLSKEIFISILEFISIDYDVAIAKLPIKDQYFAYDVYKKIDSETFIDCGAFVGEVLDQFIIRSGNSLKEYIAYEPDKISFEKLKNKVNDNYKNRNIKLYNLAVGDKSGFLAFENFGYANATVSKNGSCLTRCITIDEHLDVQPTILKIDVEGYDKQVLYGAKETIKRCMPVIAVSIYHNIDDLWEIPLWIKENFPEYKLYIRSYMNYMETVCYAVPPDRIVK